MEDTEQERLKKQLDNLTAQLEDMREHNQAVTKEQTAEVENIQKQLREAEENEQKQKARLAELQ